ncbi:uncharacterized protein AC631_05032 [Debaryomyces fabryi]|uniref:Nucleoporin Nup133/Nup155-like N-terminal domain-containing protein n=1 Tax=Debaryomyces fabryi TaxID=58627 RepID=A0A0V1PST8_9ASCO|nr:uncharacterized protein AC631_05032 [Debaryomyces fabryi]KRZ99217.1 hypothetical protein AC631_05032 [Debaryomyces fabryi]CUM52475.1 unnamed protein product [Debaryomyces fabryi]
MSFTQGSIFKPRQSSRSPIADNGIASSNESATGNGKSVFELTKNKKYCVSRLPALPAVLETDSSDNILNGYSDSASNYALVINEKAIHVWNYSSTDTTPLSIQFPLDRSSESLLPLAILTRPSSGASQDPGLVIIDSSSGLVKFYESVQHAPALGLINNKLLELTIPLNSNKGEYITLAENVEPAGIVIATSWKRCILISLRDFKSKPQLSYIELLGPSHSGGFLSSIFNGFNNHMDYNGTLKDEIVSIKSGKIANHGMTQEIIIQDSVGGFNLFSYNLFSANAVPYIEKKKTLKQNLGVYLENSIDGFLPGSSLNTKFLDLWPLESQELQDIYLGLCLIDEAYRDNEGKNLLLVTMKIDETGVLFYGSHKLIRYDPNLTISSNNKPKLYVPDLGKTAFITFDSSVILTDINTSYIQSQGTVQYYKPRWEDIVKLKSSVQVIGQGYENKSSNTNPAVILLTNNSGVLRVERFPEQSNNEMEIDEEEDVVDPIQIAKSHIEQAIFYSKSSAIEFDIKEEYSNDIIIEALKRVLDEILDSTSPYLPVFLPSIKDFLSMKSKLYHGLIHYTKRNFLPLWGDIGPQITEYLEKIEVALSLWIFINEGSATEKLKGVFKESILEVDAVKISKDEDLIRKFFSQGLSSINQVLTTFIEKLIQIDYSLTSIMDLIVKTMYNGVYENDSRYIVGSEVPSFKLWIFETSLLLRIEEVFSKLYCNNSKDHEDISTQQTRSILIQSCEVLYYFVTSAINFMKEQEGNSDQLKEYIRWYKSRKFDWIEALIRRSLDKEAIAIAEKYHDLSSLAQILEAEKSAIIEKYGENSKEFDNLLSRYSYYFEKFQYEFASNLFDFYIKNDKIQSLLVGFENYNHYVEEYFAKNNKKTSEISWIRSLLDKNFVQGAETLIESARSKSEDLQENIELKYSLAKLSAIAAKNSDAMTDNNRLEDLLYDAENNLILIRIQKHLYLELLNFVSGQKGLLNLDYVLKNFINDSLDHTTSKNLIEPFFQQFLENRPLNPKQLITLLILIKQYSGFVNGFSNALKVASLITNEHEYRLQAKMIWLRLLTSTDDWSTLAKTENKTDEYTKQKIHDSILYKTISYLGAESELLNELDELLLHYTEGLDDDREDNLVKSLNAKYLETLQVYVTNYNLKTWIMSIKQEVKNNTSTEVFKSNTK